MMSLPETRRKCCNFFSSKTGTIVMATVNCAGSLLGATWAIILISILPSQVSLFKGLNRMYGSIEDQQQDQNQTFEIVLWTIIILYLIVFIGNIIFSSVVLYGVLSASPSCLTPWFWWSSVSAIILVTNFLVKTFALMFSLPDLVICLACMVVNTYLGLGAFSFRKQLRERMLASNGQKLGRRIM